MATNNGYSGTLVPRIGYTRSFFFRNRVRRSFGQSGAVLGVFLYLIFAVPGNGYLTTGYTRSWLFPVFFQEGPFLRPMLMETRCYKVFVPNYSKTKSAEDTLAPSLLGKREKNVCFLNISCSFFHKISFVHAAARGGTCALTLKIVNTLIENSSRDDRTSISTLNQPTANPLRVGQGQ